MNHHPLLSISGMTVTSPEKVLLKGLSFHLSHNETLCLVGESGSGKSMTLRAILGILPSHSLEMTSGAILSDGEDVLHYSKEKRRLWRNQFLGFVPQSPHQSMNPMLSVGHQLMETARAQKISFHDAYKKTVKLLHKVGFRNPDLIMSLRPHQLSGGMKQRALIASALVHRPPVLLLDEPTTALDVTLQAEIIELLRSLQNEFLFSMIFVTHDLRVVARIADRVLVMKEGSIVESGPVNKLLLNPTHVYTKELIASLETEGVICN